MRPAEVTILSMILLAGVGCGGSEAPATDETAAEQGAAAEPVVEVEAIADDEFIRDPAAVTGITWEWVRTTTPVEQTEVPEPGRYTILLQPDGRLEALFDCNRGGGEYEIEQGKLSFGPLISTRMACPEDSLDALFMKDLQRVTSFFVLYGALYLEMPYDSGTLQFRASGE